MSDLPSSDPVDTSLRRFREYIAAGIALLVVLGTFGMLIAAFWFIGSNESFARVKDLLLIVNPFLGVVIGYYFNKVSTEARAESAESTARTATANAQQAMTRVETAENTVQAAQADAQQAANARDAAEDKAQTAIATLSDVQEAAEKVLAQSAPSPAVLGAEAQPSDDGRAELRAALERAKRVIEGGS
jgi:hypothetical protein